MGFALAVQFQLMATLAAAAARGPSPQRPREHSHRPPHRAPSLRRPRPSRRPGRDLAAGRARRRRSPAHGRPRRHRALDRRRLPPAPAEHLPATVSPAMRPAPSPSLRRRRSLADGGRRRRRRIRCGAERRPPRSSVRSGWLAPRRRRARGEISSLLDHAPEGRQPDSRTEQALGSLAGCGLVRSWGACLVAKVGGDSRRGARSRCPRDRDWPHDADGSPSHMDAHASVADSRSPAHADGLVLATEGKVTLDSLPVWTTPRFTASLGIDVGVRFR